MFKIVKILFISVSIWACSPNSNKVKSIDKELKRLKTNTVQIFGNDIGEIPIWSKNSDSIFLKNQKDEIFFIDLKKAKLTVGVWHNDTIGVIKLDLIKKLNDQQKQRFSNLFGKNNNEFHDSLTTQSGFTVKLPQIGLSSVLITKEKNKPEKVQWSNGSYCGVISLSPNEKYILIYCEISGVFILKTE